MLIYIIIIVLLMLRMQPEPAYMYVYIENTTYLLLYHRLISILLIANSTQCSYWLALLH